MECISTNEAGLPPDSDARHLRRLRILTDAAAPLVERTFFATGLSNPRGLKFGPDGVLSIAEGGTGGTFLLERSESRIVELAGEAGIPNSCLRVTREATGLTLTARVVRPRGRRLRRCSRGPVLRTSCPQ